MVAAPVSRPLKLSRPQAALRRLGFALLLNHPKLRFKGPLRALVYMPVMIPLVAYRREYDILADIIRGQAKAVEKETGRKITFVLGTMVELPRTTLRAREIAEGELGAEFFSFGTNDLTQTALGLSRDDASPILTSYQNKGVFDVDPFVSIDIEGVGELVRMGVERGRAAKPDLKVGICGEHGGDPDSVKFFYDIGLDYVSCSPFRVPVARLAAAQAEMRARLGAGANSGADGGTE